MHWTFLFAIFGLAASTRIKNEVGLVYEGPERSVALEVSERLANIEVPIDFSKRRAQEGGLLLKSIMGSYKALPIWAADSDIRTKMSGRLNPAGPMIDAILDAYEEVASIIAAPGSNITIPAANCVLNETLGIFDQKIIESSKLMHLNFEKLSLLVSAPEKFKETSNYVDVVNFVENFLTEVDTLLQDITANLTDIHTLLDGVIPQRFRTQNCLFDFAKQEHANLKCQIGQKSILCTACVLAKTPPEHAVSTLVPVNYPGAGGGCQLWVPETENKFWGRKTSSATPGTVYEYDCDTVEDHPGTVTGFCTETPLKTDCGEGLSSNSIEKILLNCRFGFRKAEPAVRLRDGSILIQSDSVVTYEADRMLTHEAPFALYTNEPVSVEMAFGGKIDFPPDVKFTSSAVKTTSLTRLQKASMIGSCVYDKLFFSIREDYNNADIFGVAAFAMMTSLTPIFMAISVCAYCRMKRFRPRVTGHAHQLALVDRRRRQVENEEFFMRIGL